MPHVTGISGRMLPLDGSGTETARRGDAATRRGSETADYDDDNGDDFEDESNDDHGLHSRGRY